MATATEAESPKTEVDIGTLIKRHPGINGGRPIIAGTRLSVRAVVEHHHGGDDLDAILESFPTLTPMKVYAALAFYYANQELIDGEIVEHKLFGEEIIRRFPTGLNRANNDEFLAFLKEWDARSVSR